jgi:hypothetical protein
MARYPNISDHGLIGDLQTAALVTVDGTFSRPSLISAAINLDHQLDHGPGTV